MIEGLSGSGSGSGSGAGAGSGELSGNVDCCGLMLWLFDALVSAVDV
jgi:hypothetical protein